MAPFGIQWLSLLLEEFTSLSPLSNASSGSSKCLVTLLAKEVVILVDDVWYVVVTGALKPNTLGEFRSAGDFLLTIRGLAGGFPTFLGDLKTF